MIKLQKYNLDTLSLSPIILQSFISKFWNEVFANLDHPNIYLSLLVKVRFDSNEMPYRALAKLRNVSFEDKDLFTDYICDNLALLTDSYTSTSVKRLDFSYMIHKGEVSPHDRSFMELRNINISSSIPTHSVKNTFLPLSMQPNDFGKIMKERTLSNGDKLFTINGPRKEIFEIEVSSGGIVNRGQILAGRGAKAQFSWVDTKQENGFIRSDEGNQTWHCYDNGLVSFKSVPSKPFQVFAKDKKLNPDIIT